ncbi:MAG: hypothetical protein ACLPVI_08010 [Dehalococcoidales bacterium]
MDFTIGKIKNGWTLEKRNGQVELWFNHKNKTYGIYLHDKPEQWTMQAIVKSKTDADKFFVMINDMVS